MHQGHVHDPEEERADHIIRSYSRAVGLESSGRYDKAIAEYRSIVEADPQFEQAYRGLARVYLLKGSCDEAISVLSDALGFHPDSPVVHYQLALAYGGSGEADLAIAYLEKAVELGHGDAGQIAEDGRLGHLPTRDPRFGRILQTLRNPGSSVTGKGSLSCTNRRKQSVGQRD